MIDGVRRDSGSDPDRLYGGPGNDTIDGRDGRDFIDGGSGTDVIAAGSGTNNVRAIDGEADQIGCDGSNTRVFADANIDTLLSCANAAAMPAITKLSPSTGAACGAVTITGSNFTGATSVKFGGVATTNFTVVSDTQISVVAPKQPPGTVVDVSVVAQLIPSLTVPADKFTYAASAAIAVGVDNGVLSVTPGPCGAPASQAASITESGGQVHVTETNTASGTLAPPPGWSSDPASGNSVVGPIAGLSQLHVATGTPAGGSSSVTANVPDLSVSIDGGAATNTIAVNGASTAVAITAGAAADAITVNAPTASVNVNAGDGANRVTVIGAAGTAAVTSGAGNDVDFVVTPNANETIHSGDGIDWAVTGDEHAGFSASVDAGLGNDLVIPGRGAGSFDGGVGTNIVAYVTATGPVSVRLPDTGASSLHNGQLGTDDQSLTNFDSVIGGPKGNTIVGNANGNVLAGGVGDDVIDGGLGIDTMTGGGGVDTLSYASHDASHPVTVTLPAAGVTSTQSVSATESDTFNGFANLTGGGGNDTLTGNAQNNVIDGGLGNDTMTGGGGVDTLSYASHDASHPVTVTLPVAGITSTQAVSATESDTVNGFTNLTGGAGNDALTGNAQNNVIDGGLGNDTMTGGGGVDTLSYASHDASHPVTVTLPAAGTSSTQSVSVTESDTFSGFANLTGGAGNDTLTGNAQNNVMVGEGGGDVVTGMGGSNQLYGDAGPDGLLVGGAADDQLYGNAGPGAPQTDNGMLSLPAGQSYGANTFDGGAGNDFVDAANGTVDSIVCGAGSDNVFYDGSEYAADRFPNAASTPPNGDCETGQRVGWGTWKLGPAPPVTAARGLTAVSSSPGVIDLFYHEWPTDNGFVHEQFDGTTWRVAERIADPPSPIIEEDGARAPAVAVIGPNLFAIAERVHGTSHVMVNLGVTGAWFGWTDIGTPPGGVANSVQIVTLGQAAAGRAAVLTSDAGGNLWAKVATDSGWTSWFQDSQYPSGGPTTFKVAAYGGKGIGHLFLAEQDGTSIQEANLCAGPVSGCAGANPFGWTGTDVGCPAVDLVTTTNPILGTITQCKLQGIGAVSTSPGFVTVFASGQGSPDIYERVSSNDGASFGAAWSKVAPLRQDPGAVASVMFAPAAASSNPNTIQLFAMGWDQATNATSLRQIDFNPRPPGH